jgi:hypothetical protein
MSVFLLLLGGVTTAAGFALAASGFSIHDRTFDTEFVTPGTIAAVGGLLLVGMGLAVHELRRIERVLAVRAIPPPARPAEAASTAAAQSPDAPARIPFPPKPKTNPQPASPGANTATAPAEDVALESLRAKFPTLVRMENGPVVEGADASLMPRAPVRAEEDVSEVKDAAAVGRGGNGAAPVRVVPRLDAKARLSASPGRAKGSVFNAFWPAVPRRDTQTASAPIAAPLPPPLPPPIAPVPVAETAPVASPAADERAEASAVAILKSGVVEGMAYTLYSDGSIEAQLPQGTLRFGSIAALRNHIESAS